MNAKHFVIAMVVLSISLVYLLWGREPDPWAYDEPRLLAVETRVVEAGGLIAALSGQNLTDGRLFRSCDVESVSRVLAYPYRCAINYSFTAAEALDGEALELTIKALSDATPEGFQMIAELRAEIPEIVCSTFTKSELLAGTLEGDEVLVLSCAINALGRHYDNLQ